MRPLCIGTDHKARHARSIAELLTVVFRKRIVRPLRHPAVPPLDIRRYHVVEPASPVVPGDDDDGAVPVTAADDGLQLTGGPRRTARQPRVTSPERHAG